MSRPAYTFPTAMKFSWPYQKGVRDGTLYIQGQDLADQDYPVPMDRIFSLVEKLAQATEDHAYVPLSLCLEAQDIINELNGCNG